MEMIENPARDKAPQAQCILAPDRSLIASMVFCQAEADNPDSVSFELDSQPPLPYSPSHQKESSDHSQIQRILERRVAPWPFQSNT